MKVRTIYTKKGATNHQIVSACLEIASVFDHERPLSVAIAPTDELCEAHYVAFEAQIEDSAFDEMMKDAIENKSNNYLDELATHLCSIHCDGASYFYLHDAMTDAQHDALNRAQNEYDHRRYNLNK